jgi:hypothetical protein
MRRRASRIEAAVAAIRDPESGIRPISGDRRSGSYNFLGSFLTNWEPLRLSLTHSVGVDWLASNPQVSSSGKVAFKSGRGPFGFIPREMEQSLHLLLLDEAIQPGSPAAAPAAAPAE